MTKLVIDIGSAELAGDGESLRSAFAKINGNFDELYGNLQNVIPTVTGNEGRYLATDGNILVWSTLPTPSELVNGDSTLSIDGEGNVTVNGAALQPGVFVDSNPPENPQTGKLWYDTESGRMFVFYDSFWVDANPRGTVSSINQGTKASNAVGNPGDISYDANWIYICVATNTWKRAPLSGGY